MASEEFEEALRSAMEASLEDSAEASREALEEASSKLSELSGKEIKISSDGIMSIDGEDIKLSDIQSDLSEGDYKSAYERMGFDTEEPKTKEFIEQQQAKFKDSTLGQTQEMLDSPASAELETKVGDPKSPEEFKENMEKTPEGKTQLEKMQKELDDLKAEAKTPEELTKTEKFKEFMKENKLKLLFSALFIAALVLAAENVWSLAKSIQHAQNGCWAISETQKCKISPLTCNDDDLVQGDGTFMGIDVADTGFTPCVACVDKSCSAGDWIPAKISACSCDGKWDFSGYSYQNTFSTNSCVQCSGTSKEKYSAAAPPASPACPRVSGCIAKSEACSDTMNSECSSLCDTSLIMPKPGTTLKCVKKSFASALGDVFPNILKGALGDLGNILSGIKYWLLIGIAVIIGIFLLYIILKGIIGGMFSNSSPVSATRPISPVQGAVTGINPSRQVSETPSVVSAPVPGATPAIPFPPTNTHST